MQETVNMKRMRIVAAAVWLSLFGSPLVGRNSAAFPENPREASMFTHRRYFPVEIRVELRIIITQEGVVLIDSGPNPGFSDHSKAVKQLTSLPIRFLINTGNSQRSRHRNFVFSRRPSSSAAQERRPRIKNYYDPKRTKN